ncbi:MAG: DUF3108 domain-containing protein [Rickettsiales bacterium]|nr:DUF3108 domain-containing protein [Rickettsiales bacterium]
MYRHNMVMTLRYFNILCVFLLIATPALAEAPLAESMQIKALYDCQFNGIPFGRVGIEAEQSLQSYAISADIMLTGIAALFVKHSSHTTVDASGKQYGNVRYESNYRTRKKQKYVNLVYRDGLLKEEKLMPPEDAKKRPVVDMEQKKDATDPLSLLIRARQLLADNLARNKNSFTTRVFDGRRLNELSFTIAGRKTIRMGEEKQPVVVVSVNRKPIAGFTASELEDISPKEAPIVIYFSDDARLWPIRFETRISLGLISASIVKECKTGESCLLGNKE